MPTYFLKIPKYTSHLKINLSENVYKVKSLVLEVAVQNSAVYNDVFIIGFQWLTFLLSLFLMLCIFNSLSLCMTQCLCTELGQNLPNTWVPHGCCGTLQNSHRHTVVEVFARPFKCFPLTPLQTEIQDCPLPFPRVSWTAVTLACGGITRPSIMALTFL